MNTEASQSIIEKLDAIEARLLGLEKPSDGSIDPLVAVQLLFREFHNLKSSLSMHGADQTARLVHEAESCLDALRSGRGDPASDWVNILFDLVDRVRTNIETGEETADEDLSRRLGALLEHWTKGETEEARLAFPLDPDETTALREALDSGLRPFVLEKLVGEDMDDQSVQALPVFDSVAEAGKLIAWRLVREKGSKSVLTLAFGTSKSREELSLILFDPLYPISKDLVPPQERGRLTRILIVDDEPTALMLLQHYLAPYGRIDTAQTAKEALGKFTAAFDESEPYDVIFLDILIPGISGNEVLAKFRKREREAGRAPNEGARIVMASALGDYSSISTSFKNQGDAYLVKPLDFQSVQKTMAKFGFSKPIFQIGGP